MIVQYLSGSRADFGLMRRSLQALDAAPGIELSVVLTGQATVSRYGEVAGEVADAGLAIAHQVPVGLSGSDAREMALAMADELRGLADYWSEHRPDLVLLLGDRGEMLAGALAAFHLEIPIAHLHGGERSGTLDEGFRHAISKLATYHFVATDDARDRLVKMGEASKRIWVIGAPGLVEVAQVESGKRRILTERYGMPANVPVALVVFHPVVQERGDAYAQTHALLAALKATIPHALILKPNSDAGGAEIERCLAELPGDNEVVLLDHLQRDDFLSTLAAVDVLVGNSSAGIIESASLGTPCVNVGSRQEGRLRNRNTVDCPEVSQPAIAAAIQSAAALRGPFSNAYGDGKTAARLVKIIGGLPRLARAPKKQIVY